MSQCSHDPFVPPAICLENLSGKLLMERACIIDRARVMHQLVTSRGKYENGGGVWLKGCSFLAHLLGGLMGPWGDGQPNLIKNRRRSNTSGSRLISPRILAEMESPGDISDVGLEMSDLLRELHWTLVPVKFFLFSKILFFLIFDCECDFRFERRNVKYAASMNLEHSNTNLEIYSLISLMIKIFLNSLSKMKVLYLFYTFIFFLFFHSRNFDFIYE